MKLEKLRVRLDARETVFSRTSSHDVDLSGGRISNADLMGLSITECFLDGMTIDGVAVTDLLAVYKSTHQPAPKVARASDAGKKRKPK